MAKSLTTTSLTDDRNDVYITLGKISLNHVTNIIADFLLVSLSSSSGKTLFSNSSNTSPLTSWDSLATYNNEVVGEMICVNNFEKNESIYLSLYVGGEFIAQTNIPIWHETKVWTGKRTVNFSRDSDVVATLNLSIEFVGNSFANTDVAIEKILHWRVVYDAHGVEELISTLSKFKVIESNELSSNVSTRLWMPCWKCCLAFWSPTEVICSWAFSTLLWARLKRLPLETRIIFISLTTTWTTVSTLPVYLRSSLPWWIKLFRLTLVLVVATTLCSDFSRFLTTSLSWLPLLPPLTLIAVARPNRSPWLLSESIWSVLLTLSEP